MPKTESSELHKRSSSRTLPSSLATLPKRLGTTPHGALLLILVTAIPPDPISSLQKRTIKTTHKSAFVALTSVASPLDPHFSLPEERQCQPSSCPRRFRGVLDPSRLRRGCPSCGTGRGGRELDGIGRIRRRGFLEVLLTTTMSEVKSVIERDGETRNGMNGPWHPSPSPRKQTQQQQSNRPSSSFDSGQYSFNSLDSSVAVFLSRVCENWAMVGETLMQNDLLPQVGGGRIRAI